MAGCRTEFTLRRPLTRWVSDPKFSNPGKVRFDDQDHFCPLGLGNGKACFEVEKCPLLHLATNSAIHGQGNESIGIVGGAAGQGLANIHAPTPFKGLPFHSELQHLKL